MGECFKAHIPFKSDLFSWLTSGLKRHGTSCNIVALPCKPPFSLHLPPSASLPVSSGHIKLPWLNSRLHLCAHIKKQTKKTKKNGCKICLPLSSRASIRHHLLPCDYLKIVLGCRVLSDPRWSGFTYLPFSVSSSPHFITHSQTLCISIQ